MNDSKRVTFKDKYSSPGLSWQDKATLIALYHSAMCLKFPDWTMTDTSEHFHVSVGLVSENIRLAAAIDSKNAKVISCIKREDALKLLEKRRYNRE